MVGADEAPRGLHRRQDMRGAPAEIPQPGARGLAGTTKTEEMPKPPRIKARGLNWQKKT